MSRRAAVTIQRTSARTFEQIKEDMKLAFDQARIEVEAEDRRGRARSSTSCRFGQSAVESVDCLGGWIGGYVKEHVTILFATRGGVWSRHAGFETNTAKGTIAGWAMPGQMLELRTTSSTSVGGVKFSPDTLLEAGRALLGDDFELRERTPATVPNVAGHALVRNAMFAYRELLDLEKNGLAHVVALSYEDTLANLALALLYPEAFAVSQARKASHHSVARRACEILEARACEPISINGLAAELGVTVRALQLAFRKYRGESPLQFLLMQRMTQARARLLNPKPRDNVQAVAMGCGFANMSQFSNRYRALFGELPSETLSRVR